VNLSLDDDIEKELRLSRGDEEHGDCLERGGINDIPEEYNGQPNALKIIPGTHTVSIISPTGNEIMTQKVFVESEVKTIIVP
jgi:hypothetical protein